MEGSIGSQSPQRTVVFEEKGKNEKEEKETKTKTKKKKSRKNLKSLTTVVFRHITPYSLVASYNISKIKNDVSAFQLKRQLSSRASWFVHPDDIIKDDHIKAGKMGKHVACMKE